MELFSKPAAGGIVVKSIDGVEHILIQERCKENGETENGLIEIPAGKVREFENIFDCLRREIWEETGLDVTEIEGESNVVITETNGHKVISYTPFACSQNIQVIYPIMDQTFICKVSGEAFDRSDESKNIRWVTKNELNKMISEDISKFYPMHVMAIKKYLNER